jgi:hypothetical protein
VQNGEEEELEHGYGVDVTGEAHMWRKELAHVWWGGMEYVMLMRVANTPQEVLVCGGINEWVVGKGKGRDMDRHMVQMHEFV